MLHACVRSFKRFLSRESVRQPATHQATLRVEALEDRTLLDANLPQLLTLPKADFVTGIYHELLHRTPNSQEAASLTRALDHTLSRSGAIAKVLALREYVAHSGGWFANLYSDVLGRLPDSRGLAAWVAALRQGVSREVIARSFVSGSEFQRLVASYQVDAANTAGGGATLPTGAYLTVPLLVQVKGGVSNGLGRLIAALRGSGATAETTDVGGLFRVNGKATTLDRLAKRLRTQAFVRFAESEKTYHLNLAANDPGYADGTLWGLKGTNGIDAAGAWNISTGSRKATVAVVDTGIDYNHIDLYLNIWVNQAEVPVSWRTKTSAGSGYDITVSRSQVKDTDGDSRITFWDLNDAANRNLVWDNNGDGRIDADDILRPLSQGGWEDGIDNSNDGHRDDLVGWNFVANNNRPFDDQGHGTHVSGTLGAIGNNGSGVTGVNWNTQIIALKFLDGNGNGNNANAAAALRYAADSGAKVSNNSWGGSTNDSAILGAIQYAAGKGHIVVVAAGNDGKNITTSPTYPAAYHLSNMIVVAATDSGGKLAGFSNYSATLVDVGAPGASIYSTLPGDAYGYLSGTSMAAPHVTGIVALVAAAQPNLSMSQLIRQIVSTTTPLASLSGKTVTGGLVNAARAAGSASTPSAPATPDRPTWTADNASFGRLSWNAVPGATGYLLEWSLDNINWLYIPPFQGGYQGHEIYTGTSLSMEAGLYHRIAAVNDHGMSGWSASVYAGESQTPAAPNQPTWARAGGRTIDLEWNYVSGATSYTVQYWNSSTSSWTTVGNYSGRFATIENGVGYFWRVAAVNAAGTSYSPSVLAAQAPDRPSWSSAGGDDIYLFWNDTGATSYDVQYWEFRSRTWVTIATCGTTSIKILNGHGPISWRVGSICSSGSPLYSPYVNALP